jgi:hypothetical protein
MRFTDEKIARLDASHKIELRYPRDLHKDGPTSMVFDRIKITKRS